jgi:hypothetical protein
MFSYKKPRGDMVCKDPMAVKAECCQDCWNGRNLVLAARAAVAGRGVVVAARAGRHVEGCYEESLRKVIKSVC